MARLEEAIKNIVEVFLEYAGEDPKKPQLTEEQLNKMLQTEIKDPEIKEKIFPNGIEKAVAKADKNKNNKINFGEYSRCLMVLARALFHDKMAKRGKKDKEEEEEGAQEE